MAYDAFMSYSHAADGRLAPALQHGLHRLNRPMFSLRALHLFRDQTSLAVTPGLWPTIEKALHGARYFILFASPQAAASPWVKREVDWWLENRNAESILIVLTDGDLSWVREKRCFDPAATTALPENLLSAFSAEPKHLDLRWARREEDLNLHNPRFRDAVAELAAPLHGREKDELISADIDNLRRLRRLRSGAVVALVILLALALAGAWLAVQQRDRAERQAQIARSGELAARALGEGATDPELGVLLALEAARTAPTEDAASALRRLLPDLYLKKTMPVSELGAYTVSFSPSGKHLAAGGGNGVVRIFSGSSGEHLRNLEKHESFVNDVGFSPDGQRVVTVSQDATARIWDLESGGVLKILRHDAWVITARFSPDGRTLCTMTLKDRDDVRVHVWDTKSWQRLSPLDGYQGAFSENGRWLLEGSESGFTLRDLTGKEPMRVLPELTGSFIPGGISSDGRFVATQQINNTIIVWKTDADPPHRILAGHDAGVVFAAFSSDSRYLATAGKDLTARLWDLSGEKTTRILRGHSDRLTTLAFSPRDRWLATAGEDRTVRLWDVLSGRPVAQLRGHRDTILALAFHPGKDLMASAGDDTARLWRVTDAQTMTRFGDENNRYHHADLSPQSSLLVALGINSEPDLWGSRTGLKLGTISGHPVSGLHVDFHPGGQFFAVAGLDGAVRIGDAARDRVVATWRGHVGSARKVRFDSSGRFLISAGDDGTVRLWEKGRQEPVAIYTGHDSTVFDAVFSPDDSMIASGGEGGEVHFWSPETAAPIRPPYSAGGEVERILYHPAGTHLLVAVRDKEIFLLETESGKRLELPHPQGFSGASFTPDGRYLMTGDRSSHLHLWNVQNGHEIAAMRCAEPPLEWSGLSDDGQWLLTIGQAGTIHLYPWERLAPLSKLITIARDRLHRRLTDREITHFQISNPAH